MRRLRHRLSPNIRALLGAALLIVATGCGTKSPAPEESPATSAAPKPTEAPTASVSQTPAPAPVPSPAPAPAKPTEAGDAGAPAPYTGPHLVVTDSSAGVYEDTDFKRHAKLGYLRRGERVAVQPDPIKKSNCAAGWYQIVGGGFICGNDGTTDLESPKVKFGPTTPTLGEILPFRYARNTQNGTPLYKSVPTPEQMVRYEPYLEKGKNPEKGKKSKAIPPPEAPPPEAATEKSAKPSSEPEEADAGTDKPWWQHDNVDLKNFKLDELNADRDDVLAQRMVKGFYIAIDKIFKWNGRTWYKTTKGLIAPADRFWLTDASDFKGVELKGDLKLPMGWVYGGSKDRPKYTIDPETKAIKPIGFVKHFESVALTGDELTVHGTKYVATTDGSWMKKEHLRITEPGAPPAGVAPDERWIDVDLSSQTLVAFIGTTPVYATLISSGKESPIKEKDHSTPVGEWRIREKHITTTMDGDGTVAGDLPYSIEDVPYVMYFYKAYALHGAFWHRNYGVRMSHGCVNLAPLDAKYLFFFSGPRFPQGWHGAWATEQNPGSRVIIHD